VDRVLKEWARVLKVGGELRLIVPNLRYVAKRLLEDQIVPTDLWVLYGEQDYPKNFHSMGFTPNLLKSLVKSLECFDDIQIKEGNIDASPGGDSWNLMLKATKTKHLEIDNITPDDVEPGPPNESVIPIRLYDEVRERPLTDEEIEKDLAWMKPIDTKRTTLIESIKEGVV
jgi:hypothetical protein